MRPNPKKPIADMPLPPRAGEIIDRMLRDLQCAQVHTSLWMDRVDGRFDLGCKTPGFQHFVFTGQFEIAIPLDRSKAFEDDLEAIAAWEDAHALEPTEEESDVSGSEEFSPQALAPKPDEIECADCGYQDCICPYACPPPLYTTVDLQTQAPTKAKEEEIEEIPDAPDVDMVRHAFYGIVPAV